MAYCDIKNWWQYAFTPGQSVFFTIPKRGKILSGHVIIQVNQMTTALNADEGIYRSIQVQVDTASDYTGCFSGNDRSIATSNLMVQWRDDRLGLPGDTLPLYQEDHLFLIPAANDRSQDAA